MSRVIELYEKHLNPSLTRLQRLLGLDLVEKAARGCWIFTEDNRAFLDFLGGYGVFSLGHCHPRVIAAVKEQMERLPLGSKMFCHEPAALLAEKICATLPPVLNKVFFCNSGAEAIEGALKIARLATGRKKIVAMQNGFHGKTLGALSVTGRDIYREPCMPLLPEVYHIPFNDLARAVEVIDRKTAAVVLEIVQGEGGMRVADFWYLRELASHCRSQGALLIIDEVQTGLGRTGTFWAFEQAGVLPDLITSAKALGGGVLPAGAILAREEIWQIFEENPLIHTSTFGGNPLACVAGIATLQVIEEEGLVESAAVLGQRLKTNLLQLTAGFAQIIKEVRGLGLMLGLELVDEGFGGYLIQALLNRGVLVGTTLNNTRVIRLEPPLIISNEEINLFLQILEESLNEVVKEVEEDA
ncbi:putrescine aminotransferase [Carboxydocella sporoproducens DSM 16521]|uniref:Putrescine aminotransferase n=3 Tax=Carboxydocella TaxID=178898 RepID=A0A1T4PUZ1_9FIRM|nr:MULTISPECIES: aspartate aminotransferase family protein [Carboxydocella]AVX20448.1 putrescine aminotransferase [Carboxydocella thermautotrophica]AVX30869.1 putrescine aminotransferase [Carboxydocella thermautotrophica]GAW29735.1 aspartate aminotransferase family protein [Carboxydocella sp. ULO1]SJZ95372.1 putrescine aminotransferase [Carboxydocella sporoproducens DSM 16521]